MIRKAFISVAIAAACSVAAFAQSTAPDATVRAFYAYSNARSSTFNRRHIELRKKWYTPALYAAFLRQLAEDETHLKANPTDKPFFGDGLDFRPLDEPCGVGDRTYKRVQSVYRSQMTPSRADVEVKFAYPAACGDAGGKPIIYKVNLQKIGGKWLINDWTYDNGSTLVGDMKSHKY
ncbi:MAG TPA: hypothetical protein VMZ26_09085 [Pyrinomonadaceae bacterium]|nr:hypothetical protein [Pyrinomonadaceae bacterium]